MGKKLKIFISAVKKDSKYSLELYDNEGNSGLDHLLSKAKPKSRVGWIIKNNGKDDIKLKKIVRIGAKDGSDDIFSIGPRPSRGNKWKGVVAKDAKGKQEDYFIEYRIKGDDKVYYCDPIIQVRDDDEEEEGES